MPGENQFSGQNMSSRGGSFSTPLCFVSKNLSFNNLMKSVSGTEVPSVVVTSMIPKGKVKTKAVPLDTL